MSKIKFSDIFDFDGIQADLAKAKSDVQEFASSVAKLLAEISAKQKEYTDQLKATQVQLSQMNTNAAASDIHKLAQSIDALTEKITKNRAAQKTAQEANEAAADSIATLKKVVNTTVKELEKMSETERKAAIDSGVLSNGVADASKAINEFSGKVKEAKRAVDFAANSYSELSADTARLKKEMREAEGAIDGVTGAWNMNNAVVQKNLALIKQNDQALKRLDASMGEHKRSVGDYQRALDNTILTKQGLKNEILGLGVRFLALDAIISGVQGFVQKNLEIQRYELAIKAASTTQTDFQRNLAFLERTARDYSLDLISLGNGYKMLAGSTRGTALEGQKTMDIFRGLAAGASALQLSAEDTEGVMRALGQMLSKNTVQMEELKGQLGDRLPGALGMAASAMGKTTAELSKQIEKAEVLSSDMLPKLAKAYEEVYGDDAKQMADTMAGSINNLSNQWILFLKQLGDMGPNSWITKAVNGLGYLTEQFRLFLKGLNAMDSREFWFGGSATIKGRELQAKEDRELEARGVISMTQKDAVETVKKTRSRIIELTQLINSGEILDKEELNSLKETKKELLSIYNIQNSLLPQVYKVEKEVNDIRAKGLEFQRKRKQELEDEIGYMSHQLKVNKALTEEEKKQKQNQVEYMRLVASRLNPPAKPKPDKTAEKLEKKTMGEMKESLKLAEDFLLIAKDQGVITTMEYHNKLFMLRKNMKSEMMEVTTDLNKKDELALEIVKDQLAMERAITDERKLRTNVDFLQNKDVAKRQTGIDASRDIASELGISAPNTPDATIPLVQLFMGSTIRSVDNDITPVIFSHLVEMMKKRTKLIIEEAETKKKLTEDVSKAERKANRESLRDIRLWQKIAQEAIGAVNNVFRQYTENRMTLIRQTYEREMELAGNNEDAQRAIRKKQEAEEKKAKRAEAQREKMMAILQASLNLAIAISSPKLLEKPFLIAAASIGLAAALATPLPKFAKGKKKGDSYEGLGLVGEAGAEIVERKGDAMLVDKPTVMHVDKDTVIHPAAETKRILEQGGDSYQRMLARKSDMDRIYADRIRSATTQQLAQAVVNTQRIENSIERGFDKVSAWFVDAQGHMVQRTKTSVVKDMTKKKPFA